MINYRDAMNIIAKEFEVIEARVIEVELLDCMGYVLAEDVLSDIDQPPFDNSAMDGIAVKFNSDVREWKLVGEISAGNFENHSFSENETVRIMTGAKLPSCADTVIPIEDLDEIGEQIKLLESAKYKKNNHVRGKGENLKLGQIAVAKNTKISAINIPILAACGKTKVKVFDKFKIGILSTGDELVDISEFPGEDKIRASNIYSLQCLIKQCGHEAVSFGIVSDDRESTEKIIDEILQSDIDILLTTGGVSVGKYDYLKEILADRGVEEIFWKVNIKPGKPLYFGKYDKSTSSKYIFGIPGNPVSAYVTYLVFVQQSLDQIFGISNFETVNAVLKSNLKKKDGKRHFSRGNISWDAGNVRYVVKDVGSISSGNMASLNYANCLMIFEEDKNFAAIGEEIACIRI
jgi:molybdopterin molybdotransferase